MSTHAEPGMILACPRQTRAPMRRTVQFHAQAADAAWSPAALGAHAALSVTLAGAAWQRTRRPRHRRPRSAQRDTRTGRCRRQRPGSSDSSTAAAAPRARTQERAAAAAACSHSLGCDRRNASDTARREHAPMGNSASSARKAAVFTARGTYRGPPTCAAALVAQQRAESLEAFSGQARAAGARDQWQLVRLFTYLLDAMKFKQPNCMGTPGLCADSGPGGCAVHLCLQTSCYNTATKGCVVPCVTPGTCTCVRLCSSICRRRRVVRLQRARKGESRRASSACRYLPGQPLHAELHCTAASPRYKIAAMCCIWNQTDLRALPPEGCHMAEVHAEMLCLGKGQAHNLAIDHCESSLGVCMW